MKGVRCVEGHIKKNPSFPTLKCVLGYTRKPRLTVGLEPTTESHNGCVLLVKLHISILEELSRIELLHRECPKVAKFHQFVGSARWRNFERDSNERLGDLPSRSMMWKVTVSHRLYQLLGFIMSATTFRTRFFLVKGCPSKPPTQFRLKANGGCRLESNQHEVLHRHVT